METISIGNKVRDVVRINRKSDFPDCDFQLRGQ